MWKSAAAVTLCGGLVLSVGCGGSATPPDGPTPKASPAAPNARPGNEKTGATDSIPASALGEQHVQDIAELLQSRVPGLRVVRLPNGDLSLRIRGGDMSLQSGADGTISATSAGEPLIVIDGMPVSEGQVSNTLRALNPHEIDSIQVLKDVSSTSSYGMRGAHGVILISMKKRD